MRKILKYIAFGFSLAIVSSCSTEDELTKDWIDKNKKKVAATEKPSAGKLDLSKYVSIGNSLTAGFTDGALNPQGQANSYPAILAKQFKLAGGGDFKYPNISTGNGFGRGKLPDGSPTGRSYIDVAAARKDPSKAIKFTKGSPLKPSSVKGADLNNFGVPGARIIDIPFAGYGNANPYFKPFMTSPTTSILKDALSAKPKFFTLWAGSNDVLGYALSGGSEGEAFNPKDPRTITSSAAFQASLKAILDGLQKTGAKGVVLSVPPVVLIPFVRAVNQLRTHKLIPMDAATAGAVSKAYEAKYNRGLDAAVKAQKISAAEAEKRKIKFVAGNNPPVIADESLTNLLGSELKLPSIRQATAQDLFLLTSLQVLGKPKDPKNPKTTIIGVSPIAPLEDKYTLLPHEQKAAVTAYATFNAIIKAQVAARKDIELIDTGILFADIYGLTKEQAALLQLSQEAQNRADGKLGIQIGGTNLVPLSLTPANLFNSIWSTDGVHPNPRGAAIVANEIIKTMNAKFGSKIPEVNPLVYPGINAPVKLN